MELILLSENRNVMHIPQFYKTSIFQIIVQDRQLWCLIGMKFFCRTLAILTRSLVIKDLYFINSCFMKSSLIKKNVAKSFLRAKKKRKDRCDQLSILVTKQRKILFWRNWRVESRKMKQIAGLSPIKLVICVYLLLNTIIWSLINYTQYFSLWLK